MTAPDDLVARSSGLKGELLKFALRPRFERQLRQVVDRHLDFRPNADETEFIGILDSFVLQHRLPGGRFVVELFVAEHPELPEEERAMLLGWRDVVDGIFVAGQRDGEALLCVNLADDLTYRVRSNMGVSAFRPMRPGSFLITRLIPVGEEWLISGLSNVLPAASHDEAYRLALRLVSEHPERVFRNPEKLAKGWALQRQEYEYFIAFFGADQIVLPGRELAGRMREYAHFRLHQARDGEGKTAAERSMETYGAVPPALDYHITPELARAETTAAIFDETEGLRFYANFGLVEAVFANPTLAAERKHKEMVLSYLKDRDISPLPFRRLAARDPARASRVFQRVLKQPGFSWERDGESLLRRYKAHHFTAPVLPSLVVLGEHLAKAQRAMTAPGPAPAGGVGRWRLAGTGRES